MTTYDKMSRDELLDALKVRDERDRRAQEPRRTFTIQFALDWTPGGDVPLRDIRNSIVARLVEDFGRPHPLEDPRHDGYSGPFLKKVGSTVYDSSGWTAPEVWEEERL